MAMSLDLAKLRAYFEEEGWTWSSNIQDIINKALETNKNVRVLAVDLLESLGVVSPGISGDSVVWAGLGNLDIQVAEMLGRSGYSVWWSEEEYSYH